MTELWQHSDVVNTTPGRGMYDLGTSCKLAPARDYIFTEMSTICKSVKLIFQLI